MSFVLVYRHNEDMEKQMVINHRAQRGKMLKVKAKPQDRVVSFWIYHLIFIRKGFWQGRDLPIVLFPTEDFRNFGLTTVKFALWTFWICVKSPIQWLNQESKCLGVWCRKLPIIVNFLSNKSNFYLNKSK